MLHFTVADRLRLQQKPDKPGSEDSGDPWVNQATRSSPIVSKLKEPKSIEGSDILLEERQELLSSVPRFICVSLARPGSPDTTKKINRTAPVKV